MVNNMGSIHHVYLELPFCLILIQPVTTYTENRPKDKINYFHQFWATILFLCFLDLSRYHTSQGG